MNKLSTYVTGFAMFAMFFGAGNVAFPLEVGRIAQGQVFFSILGLIITAVGIPFCGVVGVALYEGDYQAFFRRIGGAYSVITIGLLILLIGPIGGIPRCIALSYSNLSLYFTLPSFPWFSLFYSLVVIALCINRSSIVSIMGYVLTPLLLFSIFIILLNGLKVPVYKIELYPVTLSPFLYGLREGYNTMDLLGSFFFSSIVYQELKNKAPEKDNKAQLLKEVLLSSAVGGFLLSIVYAGLGIVSALHSESIMHYTPERLLSAIAHLVLGPYAGLIACILTVMACLTTVVALATVTSEFIQTTVKGAPHLMSLVVVLFLSSLVATLGFSSIVAMLSPVLNVIYPSLLALCIANILHKLYNFKFTKTLVSVIFLLALLIQLLG